MTDLLARRAFLRAAAAAGAAWATADLLGIDDALAWAARQTAATPSSAEVKGDLTTLTPEQARTLDAAASRIIPSVDGRPGAHECGVVYFIDRSLSTYNAQQKAPYAKGIKDLDRRAARLVKGVTTFAALQPAQQDEILRAIEKTPFFEMLRFGTIVGTFALPSYGGNRDHLGWHMLGLTHQPVYQPPFGYYDADVNKRTT
jgi:gluconate 2-dehydrogenase gamma chain